MYTTLFIFNINFVKTLRVLAVIMTNYNLKRTWKMRMRNFEQNGATIKLLI
jgi:hypothetical protein